MNGIFTLADLKQFVGNALREQHPEWVECNGDSSLYDIYESRFANLLAILDRPATQRSSDAVPV